MALIGEDLFGDNILDDPDDLERVEEVELYQNQELEADENDGGENDSKKTDGNAEVKIRRKVSERPKLNILRLMGEKNGLTTVKKVFEDIKLKGKGYEREDLNLVMRKLEIWTHQLFPSLQFDDCLGKLEKLGTTRSVMTYVTKIRMGLEDTPRTEEIIDEPDDSGNEAEKNSLNTAFDRLINERKVSQANNNSGLSSDLTTEQRERMMRNRLIAEQRRLARMKARQEQALSSTNTTSNEQAVNIENAESFEMVVDEVDLTAKQNYEININVTGEVMSMNKAGDKNLQVSTSNVDIEETCEMVVDKESNEVNNKSVANDIEELSESIANKESNYSSINVEKPYKFVNEEMNLQVSSLNEAATTELMIVANEPSIVNENINEMSIDTTVIDTNFQDSTVHKSNTETDDTYLNNSFLETNNTVDNDSAEINEKQILNCAELQNSENGNSQILLKDAENESQKENSEIRDIT